MTLRCGKHLTDEATKYQLGNLKFLQRKDKDQDKNPEVKSIKEVNKDLGLDGFMNS